MNRRGTVCEIRIPKEVLEDASGPDQIDKLLEIIGDCVRRDLADGAFALGGPSLLVEFSNVGDGFDHGCLCDEFPCPYDGPSDIPGTLDLVRKRVQEFGLPGVPSA